jgi:hypothetical protein
MDWIAAGVVWDKTTEEPISVAWEGQSGLAGDRNFSVFEI